MGRARPLNPRYTLAALAQIDAILRHVGQRSPRGAAGLRDRIAAAAALVGSHPRIGQATSRAGVRRVVLSPYPYILYYRLASNEVVVTRVRHAARRPEP